MHSRDRGFLRGKVFPTPLQCPPLLLQCRSLSPETGALPLRLSSCRTEEGSEEDRLSSGGGGRQMPRSFDSKQSLHALLRLWEREAP